MGLVLPMDPNLLGNLIPPQHRADSTEPLSDMQHRAGNSSELAQSCVLPPAFCQEGFSPCADAEQPVLLGEEDNVFRSAGVLMLLLLTGKVMPSETWPSVPHVFWKSFPRDATSQCLCCRAPQDNQPLLLLPKGSPAEPSSITARPAALQELRSWTRFVLITYLPVKTLRFRIKGKEIILRGYFNEQKTPYFVPQVTLFNIKTSWAYN